LARLHLQTGRGIASTSSRQGCAVREVRLMYSIPFRGRRGDILLGAAFLALGVGLTWWSLQADAPGAARLIFAGLLLGGLVRLLTALLVPSTVQVLYYCWQCGAQV